MLKLVGSPMAWPGPANENQGSYEQITSQIILRLKCTAAKTFISSEATSVVSINGDSE
jgi:hypothetical protein